MANEKIKELNNNFILVQFCGGQSPLGLQRDGNGNLPMYDDHQEALKRNYYKGQLIIDAIKNKNPDSTIVHFSLPNEPSYNNAVKFEMPYLTYYLLAKAAKAVVTTDSSLQHIATGACKNVTVIWGETRPEHFGYECNKNICAKNVLNSQPYFKPLGISPSIVTMPEPQEILDLTGLCA